jgi:hypothetical protein
MNFDLHDSTSEVFTDPSTLKTGTRPISQPLGQLLTRSTPSKRTSAGTRPQEVALLSRRSSALQAAAAFPLKKRHRGTIKMIRLLTIGVRRCPAADLIRQVNQASSVPIQRSVERGVQAPRHPVERLHRGLPVREVPTSPHIPPVVGVQRLDRI